MTTKKTSGMVIDRPWRSKWDPSPEATDHPALSAKWTPNPRALEAVREAFRSDVVFREEVARWAVECCESFTKANGRKSEPQNGEPRP